MLYGQKDEIIPAEPTRQFIHDFLQQNARQKKIACYKNGYHMLLRDLEAPLVWRDMKSWIMAEKQTLPSGSDKHTACDSPSDMAQATNNSRKQ